MKLIRSLSIRVFLGSMILLMTLFGIYSYFAIKFHTDQVMEYVLGSATRLSDVIKNSTHYSMLLDRREDVYQSIMMMGKEPGVEGIRIYNKRGEIMFSTEKGEEHRTVDMHGEACFACHEQEKPLGSLSMSNRTRIYTAANGHRVLGLINPIRNEAICSNADCHAHEGDKTVLGVLDVRMSLENVDRDVNRARMTLLFWAVAGVFLVSVGTSVLWYRTVHRPVKLLTNGTRVISSGDLSREIPVSSADELGQLAESFNAMTHSLRKLIEEKQRWSQELEEKVREKTGELSRIHEQILQIEKMTSLGKLAATVAHELNNPLEGILTYAKLIVKQLRKVEFDQARSQEIQDELALIIHETDRCGNIVKNLLFFSRKQVGEFALVPVFDIVEKARRLVNHHFQISNVKFEYESSREDAKLMCDEHQIQQALVALFVNAVEAMPEGGALRVKVHQEAGDLPLTMTISDSGSGIAEEDLSHIFEPFFTTKKEGKGVGLGLSVVYGIVERHGGTIEVASKPNQGTSFTITFPPLELAPSPEQHGSRGAGAEQH
ncbi:MAG TPA: ATP-binding protein [Bacteroidota bacterium]|nr:ATP-binding protein [Bacteroidota bacterium]